LALAAALLRQGFSQSLSTRGEQGVVVGVPEPAQASVDVGSVVGEAPVVAAGPGGSVIESVAAAWESSAAVCADGETGHGVQVGNADDQVSEASEGSVSGGSPGVVGAAVRERIKFGGLADSYSQDQGQKSTGFYAVTSRRSETLQLKSSIEALSGVKLPKRALVDLGICLYAAGSMPVAIQDGKARLRSLAAVGDAALTLHLATSQMMRGRNVESAQGVRSRLTSNIVLREVMVQRGFMRFMSYPSGVDPATTAATATALEAIIGVVTLYRDSGNVLRFLSTLGLLG